MTPMTIEKFLATEVLKMEEVNGYHRNEPHYRRPGKPPMKVRNWRPLENIAQAIQCAEAFDEYTTGKYTKDGVCYHYAKVFNKDELLWHEQRWHLKGVELEEPMSLILSVACAGAAGFRSYE